MDSTDSKDSDIATEFPTPFQHRTLWKAITGIAIAIIAVLLVSAIVILGKILSILQPVLVPLAIAGIMTYLLAPVVQWTRKRALKRFNVSRTQAIGVVFAVAAIATLLIGLAVVIPASQELSELFEKRASIIEGAQNRLAKFNNEIASIESIFGINHEPPANVEGENLQESQIWKELVNWAKSPETSKAALLFLRKTANGFIGAIGYIVGFFLIPVYLFFFLRDSEIIQRNWDRYIPLKKSTLKDELVGVVKEVNGYLVAYFRGQVIVSIIDGVLTGIALSLMGLDYALIIGVSLAVLGIIPFVGIILTAIPALIIAAGQINGPEPIWVLVVFIAVQQIDGLLVQPKIVGESVGLHPLTVIFSVLCWSLLIGGILGALLAVPLTAAIKVLFRRYIWEQKIRTRIGLQPDQAAT